MFFERIAAIILERFSLEIRSTITLKALIILKTDIKAVERINRAIRAKAAFPGKNYRLLKIIIVQPPVDQQFGFELDFSPSTIAENIELGYEIAKNVLDGKKR